MNHNKPSVPLDIKDTILVWIPRIPPPRPVAATPDARPAVRARAPGKCPEKDKGFRPEQSQLYPIAGEADNMNPKTVSYSAKDSLYLKIRGPSRGQKMRRKTDQSKSRPSYSVCDLR